MQTIYAALAKAQAEMGKLVAGETAKVKTSTGGEYSYNYASLADVLAIVRPPLNSNGIALIQAAPDITYSERGALVTVITTLAHESGEQITEPLTLAARDTSPQGVGSAITYARRYSVQMICGLAPDSDDDGIKASQPKVVQQVQRKPTPPVATKPAAQPQPAEVDFHDDEPEQSGTADKTIEELRRKFHATMASTFGGLDVDAGRHWYITAWTMRYTDNNVRDSINDLTADELNTILEKWDAKKTSTVRANFTKFLAQQAQSA